MSYCFVGAASGWGAQILGTEGGPEAVWQSSLGAKLSRHGINALWRPILYPSVRISQQTMALGEGRLPFVAHHCDVVAHHVRDLVLGDQFPIVVGGDHAVAVGTWSGVTEAYKAWGEFGLLWIDAHMDAHTPQTTPSFAYHGMPVASLLGYGPEVLTGLLSAHKKIHPSHLVLFGVRSFESGEHHLLTRLGVRIFYMDEIRSRGVTVCMREALGLITQKTRRFGVSMDLDAFDPTVAPGVGSPEPGGLFPDDVLPALTCVWQHPGFSAFELVELNPEIDPQGRTAALAQDILFQVLSAHHQCRLPKVS